MKMANDVGNTIVGDLLMKSDRSGSNVGTRNGVGSCMRTDRPNKISPTLNLNCEALKSE